MLTSGTGDANVYLYEFSTRPAISTRPDYIVADHGDDLFFIFGFSSQETLMGMPYQYAADESIVQGENMMMQYFSSFAKTG